MNMLIQQLGKSLCSILMLLVFCIPVVLPAGSIVVESEVNIEDVEECVLAGESVRRRNRRGIGLWLRVPDTQSMHPVRQPLVNLMMVVNGHRLEHDLLAPLAC